MTKDDVLRMQTLVRRLHGATVASCTCMTKTPDTKYHGLDCRYRILTEAANAIETLVADAHMD